MKKFWEDVLKEVILAVLTLGISILRKGKKKHSGQTEKENVDKE